MPSESRVILIAAVAQNGVIGADGGIPWHLPADFAHFKRTTMGQLLVMGRATYESIGRALPGRTTVVLTSSPDWSAPGVERAGSWPEAMAIGVQRGSDVYVAGGAAVYAAALPDADELLLSEVPLTPEGDTYFPAFDQDEWVEDSRTPDEGFEIVRWVRRAATIAG